jgi:hypothetical protein
MIRERLIPAGAKPPLCKADWESRLSPAERDAPAVGQNRGQEGGSGMTRLPPDLSAGRRSRP